MSFEILGEITGIEIIAIGKSREAPRLRKLYGSGRWRKLKGLLKCGWKAAKSGPPNYIGTKLMASAKKKSNVSATSTKRQKRGDETKFVVCVANDGYPASLERHKIDRVLPDEQAERDGDLRIIDESGEDYLFPATWFVTVKVPQVVKTSLLRAS